MPSNPKILMSYTKVLLQMASQFTCREGASRHLQGVEEPEFCTQLTQWLKQIKTPEARILAVMVQPSSERTRRSSSSSTTGEPISTLPGDNMTLRLNYADFFVAAVTLYEQLIVSEDYLKKQARAAEDLRTGVQKIANLIPDLDQKSRQDSYYRFDSFSNSAYDYLRKHPVAHLYNHIISWDIADVRPDLFKHGFELLHPNDNNTVVLGIPYYTSVSERVDYRKSILQAPSCHLLLKRAVVLRRRCQEAGWDFSSAHLEALSSSKGGQAYVNRLLNNGEDLIFAKQLLEYIVEHNQVSP